MCDPVTVALITAGVTAAGAGATYIQGQKQASAAKDAQQQAQKNADATAAQADQANNRANAKSPDTAALLSDNAQQAKQGVGSTTSTSGAAGVDPSTLPLGKNTLLGS